MSSFVQLLEALLSTVIVTEEVTAQVLKSRVEELANKLKDEYEKIDEIQSSLDRLSVSHQLLNQLKVATTFISDQWVKIGDNLSETREEVFDSLQSNGEVIVIPEVENSPLDHIKAAFQGVLTVGLWYNFKKNWTPGTLENWKSNIRKTFYRQIEPVQVEPNIEMIVRGRAIVIIPNNSTPIDADRQGQVRNPPSRISYKKWITFSNIFHAFMITAMIFGVIYGGHEIDDINKKKKQIKKLLNEIRSSENTQSMISFLQVFYINIQAILNLSKFVSDALSSTFLTKGLVTATNFDYHYELAQSISSELSYDNKELEQIEREVKKIVELGNRKDIEENKRVSLMAEQMKALMERKPDEKMARMSEGISQKIGKYSIISDEVDQETRNRSRFLKKMVKIMGERNKNYKLFVKKDVDRKYLEDIIKQYNKVYSQSISLSNLNHKQKLMLFSSIQPFTSQYYYDDPSGKSLFGMPFPHQNNKTFNQFFKDLDVKTSDQIKISFENPQKEEEALKEYANQVEKLTGKKDKIIPLHRYLKYVEAEAEIESKKAVKYTKVMQGMKYIRNGEKETILGIQRDFGKRNYKLL